VASKPAAQALNDGVSIMKIVPIVELSS
jgi:hypothetical protein